jgi:hypothetical protein
MLHIFLLTGCQKSDNETINIDLGENKSDSETITIDLGEEKSDNDTTIIDSREKLDEYVNVLESEINSKENDIREQYSQETESQEHTNTSEDVVTQEDMNLLDKINKNKIEEQSFSVVLNDWGKVMFVSCMPDFDDDIDPLTDVSFYLTDDKNVLYKFPYVSQDNVRESGLCEGVSFVFFEDINEDDRDDIVIGCSYVSGAGPQGMIPYTEIRIYEDDVNKFIYNKELSEKINGSLPQDVTAENVKKLILN